MTQDNAENHETLIEEEFLTERHARQIAGMSGTVTLRTNSITCKAAKRLAQFRGKELYIEGIPEHMDECAIKELTKLGRDVLHIDNDGSPLFLSDWTLSTESFFSLAPYTTDILGLDGYDLTVSDARRLSRFVGHELRLERISFDAESARELAIARPQIFWCYRKSITILIARALAASRAWDELAIFVEGGVDKAVAKELSHYQGECLHLHIDGRPDTIHALASFRGILQVTVEHLTPEMATAFAECECCRLSLPDLESIDADSARELSNIQCHRLILEGLKSLSANAAKELVKYGEVEEKWVSMAMPASPEESVLDAMTLMGGSTPVPRPVDDDRGIVKILRNPRMLCLEGLSESDLWDEVKEILASPKTQVVFRTELDETEWMEEREES